jgi:RNA polymerase sigma factor (sigma-70 family)
MWEAMTDAQLVEAYVSGNAEAFSELVRRHTALVYSAAVRQTNDPILAEDVAQAVFILLSGKARRLGSGTVVSAWLYRAARYAARDAMKKQRRRQHHETRAAVSIDAVSQTKDLNDIWAEVAPLLDDAMAALPERDQAVVVLRFFENQSLREVGAAIGTSEATAGQRVARAVQKLRRYFSDRGVVATEAGLLTTVARHAVGPIPPAISAAMSRFLPSPGAASIARGAAKMMFWTKTKIAIVTAFIAIFAAAIPAVVLDGVSQNGSKAQPSGSTAAVTTAQLSQFQLPRGGSLELCLGDTSGDAMRLWNADGTLLNPAPFKLVVSRLPFGSKPGQTQVAIALHATDALGNNVGFSFEAMNSQGFGGGGHLEKDGKTIDNWWVDIVAVDTPQTGLDINLGLSLGLWRTLATWGTYGPPATMLTLDRGFQVEPGIPAARDGDIFVPVAIALPQIFDWDERLIANLSDSARSLETAKGNLRVINNLGITEFRIDRTKSVKPQDVVSYNLEIIPVTRLTIKGLALSPEHRTIPVSQVTPPHPFPKLKAAPTNGR